VLLSLVFAKPRLHLHDFGCGKSTPAAQKPGINGRAAVPGNGEIRVNWRYSVSKTSVRHRLTQINADSTFCWFCRSSAIRIPGIYVYLSQIRGVVELEETG